MFHRIWIPTALLLILPSCLLAQVMGPPAPEKTEPKPRVGVFTFAAGFQHETLELAERTIAKIAAESGQFEAVLYHLHRQPAGSLDLSMISAKNLAKLDALVFYTTSGEKDLNLLSDRQRAEFMKAIRGGTAFVGIHSATDTFYKWPEYGEMIGAWFDGHPWTADGAPVTIKVEDHEHPAARPFGSSWFVQEEIYQFRAPYDRKKLHVLLSLDTSATDMSVAGVKRTDGDFAVAWTKYHGKGRVFYTALGHNEDVWRDELFQAHLLGGIRWALGQLQGNPPPPDAPKENWLKSTSGLRTLDLVVGTGTTAKLGHEVSVHLVITLTDGTVFENTREDGGGPATFLLGRHGVRKGIMEGVHGMKIGGKRKMIIPADLGYGPRGLRTDGPNYAVPPNSTLVCIVELLGIDENPAPPAQPTP